jgi:NAD(P)-dependent dehydrogenase (short-subunit alcohol dehydrogenase family)
MAAHPGSKVEVGPSLDLMSQDSVKKFAAAIAKRPGPLNILVNNAGCALRFLCCGCFLAAGACIELAQHKTTTTFNNNINANQSITTNTTQQHHRHEPQPRLHQKVVHRAGRRHAHAG